MNRKTFRVATIPGDGIGKEVVPAAQQVLNHVANAYGFALDWTEFNWSCEHYARTGRMMPENGLEVLREHDQIFLGAVGSPDIPDHISLWGLLIPIRRAFRQYINKRPVMSLPGVESPLRDLPDKGVDFIV